MQGSGVRGKTLVKSGSYYMLQAGGMGRGWGNGFLFKRALATPAYVKEGLDRTASRLLEFGYRDFSDRRLAGPATHLLRRQGKMIRPALIFVSAHMLHQEAGDFVDLAVAGELLHTASLIHDDLIDRDIKRRGAPAVHVKYGQEAAILAGDALIAKAIQIGAKYGKEVLEAMAKSAIDMCAGELLDYEYQKRREMPDLKTYLRVAHLKTAVLVGRCASIVALRVKSDAVDSLMNFGTDLGVAFQIRDDVMEIIDDKERRENGGASPLGFKLNIVDLLEERSRMSRGRALEKAAEMNNYFADRALASIADEEFASEWKNYVDFVRIKKS